MPKAPVRIPIVRVVSIANAPDPTAEAVLVLEAPEELTVHLVMTPLIMAQVEALLIKASVIQGEKQRMQ